MRHCASCVIARSPRCPRIIDQPMARAVLTAARTSEGLYICWSWFRRCPSSSAGTGWLERARPPRRAGGRNGQKVKALALLELCPPGHCPAMSRNVRGTKWATGLSGRRRDVRWRAVFDRPVSSHPGVPLPMLSSRPLSNGANPDKPGTSATI
jgi:hypothetical protein